MEQKALHAGLRYAGGPHFRPGSGASFFMLILGVFGILICLILGHIMNRYTFVEE